MINLLICHTLIKFSCFLCKLCTIFIIIGWINVTDSVDNSSLYYIVLLQFDQHVLCAGSSLLCLSLRSCLSIGFRSRGHGCCLMGCHRQSMRKASTTTIIWLTVCLQQVSSHLLLCTTGTCRSRCKTSEAGPATNSSSILMTLPDSALHVLVTG